MKRREFIAALGAGATWPLLALAQQRIPRVAYFSAASAEMEKPFFEAFEAGLRELGYIPGKSIEIESRYADGHDDWMAEQARELVALEVDVIEQHVGGFTAELLMDALNRRGRAARNLGAGARRAGEGHHVYIRMRR